MEPREQFSVLVVSEETRKGFSFLAAWSVGYAMEQAETVKEMLGEKFEVTVWGPGPGGSANPSNRPVYTA